MTRQQTTSEWARSNGTEHRAWTNTTNYDPPRPDDTRHFTLYRYVHPTTDKPGAVIPGGLDLLRDVTNAVFLLDDGRTVEPFYVAGWHHRTRDVMLHPFPTNYDRHGQRLIRDDNGRPVDHGPWSLGPRRAYHVKIAAVDIDTSDDTTAETWAAQTYVLAPGPGEDHHGEVAIARNGGVVEFVTPDDARILAAHLRDAADTAEGKA